MADGFGARDGPIPYAARHLADLIVRGSLAPNDPKTLAAWARVLGRSRGSLRGCCEAAKVRPRAALDLARVLRLVRLRPERPGWSLSDFLDVSDDRSVRRLLRRGGLDATSASSLTIGELVHRQTYIVRKLVLDELASLLD